MSLKRYWRLNTIHCKEEKLSVIIPTLNSEKHIVELLHALKKQSALPEEIIVIDSSSNDGTVVLARRAGCVVKIIDRCDFDHGGTRNLAVEMASGEILIFLTHDAVPKDTSFLKNLVEPLKNPDIAASYGRQIAMPDAIPPEKFARLFNYPERPLTKGKSDLPVLGIKTFFFSDVCSAVRKREFKRVGGFPDRIIMNEDMVLAAKLILQGYKISYVPEAAVWHSHNYDIYEYLRRYFDIGVSLNANRWILEHSRAEGEGLRFTGKQLSYLFQGGHYRWIPYAIGLTLAKYTGYRLGFLEKKLPVRIKRVLSMHKHYWI